MKTTNQSAKFETLKAFCLLFRTGVWKDFYQKVSIEFRCYRTGNYTVSRRINTCFFFCPEMLQTGAVKGLMICICSFCSFDFCIWNVQVRYEAEVYFFVTVAVLSIYLHFFVVLWLFAGRVSTTLIWFFSLLWTSPASSSCFNVCSGGVRE